MISIKIKISQIQKLGEFFRQHHSDWKMVLLRQEWKGNSGMYIREIGHEGGGEILALARVEVPTATFVHFQHELEELGDRSIGDHFLYVRDDVVRDLFEVSQEEGQWLRRAHYLVDGYPLTVIEYFTEKGLECFVK